MIIVPDASVILKWVLEKESDRIRFMRFGLKRRYWTIELKSSVQPSGAMKSEMCWG